MARTNQLLLDELSDQQRNAVLAGADAIKVLADFSRRSFDLWMDIARGVAVLCKLADRPGMSRKARKNLLKDNGYGTLNEGTVSRLLRMAEHEPDIRVWRANLTEKKRESWNSPTSICNRCPAVRQAIAAANARKPVRQRKPKDARAAMVKVEQALDVIGDVVFALADADARALIAERLLRFVDECRNGARIDEPALAPKFEKPVEAKTDAKAEPLALHTPDRDVRSRAFCGPTAMAAVTGLSVSVIRDTVRTVTGKTVRKDGSAWPVNGVAMPDLVAAMARLGYKVVESEGETAHGKAAAIPPIRRDGRALTLGRFLDERGDDGPFIVCGGWHYFAVANGQICDTYTKGPVDIATFDRGERTKLGRKSQVKAWWKFAVPPGAQWFRPELA